MPSLLDFSSQVITHLCVHFSARLKDMATECEDLNHGQKMQQFGVNVTHQPRYFLVPDQHVPVILHQI
ncbi:hypothetical protein JHK82_030933 [Glycine max]|uniref:Uncharacterized protein n=2 Tax=Glycine subgen. Soja TaxID=1462606 RepID=K7LPP2_SOYBN|nr:hypothetical protein JHK87_030846 [Glycine soja]KAG4988597.1 hypothetical protein JHK85_031580 [Glycine max]KAG4994203.1 hypothetical protein JHK86_031030 [Glycine max]KAG5124196.1 hypothetical protein JHK82_030933 [Glycine max]KAG5145616.1 hypothetical protein JHK84_031159 [Glycine max]